MVVRYRLVPINLRVTTGRVKAIPAMRIPALRRNVPIRQPVNTGLVLVIHRPAVRLLPARIRRSANTGRATAALLPRAVRKRLVRGNLPSLISAVTAVLQTAVRIRVSKVIRVQVILVYPIRQ